MASYLVAIPRMADFFPPTPQAYNLLFRGFQAILPVTLCRRLVLSSWGGKT